MTDKELRILDEMLTNLEIWSTWNKTFSNEMLGICSKMRSLLADHKTEPQTDTHLQRLQMCADCEHTDMCEWCYSRWAKDEPQTEPQTEIPCENCQEWDCYGCDYKQAEGADDE